MRGRCWRRAQSGGGGLSEREHFPCGGDDGGDLWQGRFLEERRERDRNVLRAKAPNGRVEMEEELIGCASGDLRAESDGPKRYFSAFRDSDQFRYLLDEGPAFIHLDADTGLITATPGREHLGFHTITFRVHNGPGSVDLQGFDLEVVVD